MFAPLAVIPIPLLERDSKLRLDLMRAATRKAEAARAREWERKHGRQACLRRQEAAETLRLSAGQLPSFARFRLPVHPIALERPSLQCPLV